MTKNLTFDRVLFLSMSLVVLFATTQRFGEDLYGLISFLVIVGGVVALD